MRSRLQHARWLVFASLALGCTHGSRRSEHGSPAGGAERPGRVQCGQKQCEPGQVCCNPSCGICAPPDGMCTQQFCDQSEARAGQPPAEPPSLAPAQCEQHCRSGSHCELMAVQCVRAPCEPVPQCVPDSPSP